MPSACFDGNHKFSVKTHWKHAEGMSLRYGVIFFRYGWGQKNPPAWWVPHRGRYLMRWLGGFYRRPNFYILYLVTCQDNVNQSGNVGHVHYAVGVDVASIVSVS